MSEDFKRKVFTGSVCVENMNCEDIKKKLLCFGLFPEKLSKIFVCEDFGNWVIFNNVKFGNNIKDFSLLSYKATRNNNSPRVFGIPNPKAYITLCNNISENWNNIENTIYHTKNYNNISMVTFKENNLNKRLISWDSYDKNYDSEILEVKKQLGKKYYVYADISNFFPSIYTHSIPWALVGTEIAKSNWKDRNLWYNKIDEALRCCQDKETKGIPIGPDTSSLISEIILSQIDNNLKKYEYNRFVDDFTCFCRTREEAENFIVDLSRELECYRLLLNTKKTEIKSLPKVLNNSWIRKLRSEINWDEIGRKEKNKVLSFLDLSSEVFLKNPSESSIRYAVKVLKKKKYKDYKTFQIILNYVFNLAFLYPYIIDICWEFIDIGLKEFSVRKNDIIFEFTGFLNSFLEEHSIYRRTDAILWGFFYGIIYDIDFKNVDKIRNYMKDDCIAVLMMYLYSKFKLKDLMFYEEVFKELNNKTERLKGSGNKADNSEWWLFAYEFSRIENKVLSIDMLEKMRKNNISFLSSEIISKINNV